MQTGRWALLSLLIAVVGTLGSLYLSIGMGLKACPLCFYQRTFIMAAFAVLAVGLLVDRSQAGLLCLLCLPLAVAGTAVAAYHEYLVLASKLECPKAILSIGTAPAQSLAVFVALTAVVAVGCRQKAREGVGAAAFGLALAWGCVASAPPMPPTPQKPYDQPLEICRPPFNPNAV